MAGERSPALWRLYVITDERPGRGRSHLQIAEAAIRGGADVVQLRDKTASGRRLYDIAVQMRRLTRDAGVPFVVNDRLDVALAVDADGVHLGREDLPASVARRILAPGKIVGVSVETVEEAVMAEKDGADYLGAGPVFEARGSKADAGEPLGLDLIARIRRNCRLPIVAIGGINTENARLVREAGADAAAVISAVAWADDVAQAARLLKRELTAADRGL
ncbi:MAG: thiamine phosphate synthase [Deltaproteobacteria bacterium]|nr:thiamine phosphate synthase [Deltaproteobacteria bacterium]PWB67002.1 MAG: thiamine phosphate synthase [Deltaproteobacteria bacterium]